MRPFGKNNGPENGPELPAVHEELQQARVVIEHQQSRGNILRSKTGVTAVAVVGLFAVSQMNGCSSLIPSIGHTETEIHEESGSNLNQIILPKESVVLRANGTSHAEVSVEDKVHTFIKPGNWLVNHTVSPLTERKAAAHRVGSVQVVMEKNGLKLSEENGVLATVDVSKLHLQSVNTRPMRDAKGKPLNTINDKFFARAFNVVFGNEGDAERLTSMEEVADKALVNGCAPTLSLDVAGGIQDSVKTDLEVNAKLLTGAAKQNKSSKLKKLANGPIKVQFTNHGTPIVPEAVRLTTTGVPTTESIAKTLGKGKDEVEYESPTTCGLTQKAQDEQSKLVLKAALATGAVVTSPKS